LEATATRNANLKKNPFEAIVGEKGRGIRERGQSAR